MSNPTHMDLPTTDRVKVGRVGMPPLGGSTLYPPTLTTAASRTVHDVLLERATIDATTLAPDVLAGYRRAGLGGEDGWLATALGESSCG